MEPRPDVALADPTWGVAYGEIKAQDTGHGVPQFDHNQIALAKIFGAAPIASACVRANATAATRAEIKVRKVSRNGDVEILEDHPLLDVFDRPNPRMTGPEWRLDAGMQLETFGQFFNTIDRQNGRDELWPMSSARVTINPSNRPTDPIAGYTFEAGGSTVRLRSDQVVHGRYPGPWPENILHGHSKLRDLWPVLQQASLQDKWIASFFANAAVLGGVLSVPGELTDRSYKRLLAQITKRMGRRWHEPYIAEGGAKWERVQSTIKEVMPTELDEVVERKILAVMGTPRIALAFPGENFATAREQRRSWWNQTLGPLLDTMAAALNVSSLVQQYATSGSWLEVFFDLSTIEELQKDAMAQAQVDAVYITAGVYGPEYVQQREGYPEPEEPEMPEPAPDVPEDGEGMEPDPPEESQETEREDELSAVVPIAVVWPKIPESADPPLAMKAFCEEHGLEYRPELDGEDWMSPQGIPTHVVASTFRRGMLQMGRIRPGASADFWGLALDED